MRKLIVSEWISLDGVFDAANMTEWFFPYHSDVRAAHIAATINSTDIMLYGRTTYEMLAPYWSALQNNEMGVADRLNNAPKYVVSTNMKEGTWGQTTIIRENVVNAITELKHSGDGNILVQGSAKLAATLMRAGLVDEYRFLVQPIIAGSGRRFFEDGMAQQLQLTKAETLDNGVLFLCYKPA